MARMRDGVHALMQLGLALSFQKKRSVSRFHERAFAGFIGSADECALSIELHALFAVGTVVSNRE